MPGPIAKRRITQVIIEPAPVTAPSPTNQALAFDGTPSAKTFSAFTDPDARINNYVATINNTVGTTTISGSGRGPYTFSGYASGDTFTLVLTARDSSNRALASAVHTVSIEAEEPPPPAEVVAPASTSEALASNGTPTNKTFSSFTDPDNRINNYQAVVMNVSGTITTSGSGLGPYSFSGWGPDTAWTLKLNARDSSNNVLATAIHTVSIATETVSPVIPPATTNEVVVAGGAPANKTFSSFTDTAGRISSYSASIVNVSGSTSISGSNLGPYSFTGYGNGDAFSLKLDALDSEGEILATAIHIVVIEASAPVGPYDWTSVEFDFAAATLAGPWTTGTNNVTGAAASTVGVISTRSSTTNGEVEVIAEGLETRASSGTGNMNSVVDLQPYLLADNAFFTDYVGVVVVQACYKLAQLTGSGSYWAMGVTNKTLQGQAFCGVACNYSAGNVIVTTYYDTVSNTTLYSGSVPTEFRVTVMIYQGRTSRVKFEAGVSTLTEDPPSSGWQFTGQPTLAANTAQFFGDAGGADFGWLTSVRSNGAVAEVTLTALSVKRLEVIP